MEGKAALFKRFAGIDAWPICLDTQDTDEIVRTVQAHRARLRRHQPGGHLGAPRCFEIERRLRGLLDIPVFHDDQHGTAIVVLAALTNALRVVGKQLAEVRVACPGRAPPARRSSGCCSPRARPTSIVCDDRGAIVRRADPGLTGSLRWIAEHTNPDGVRRGPARARAAAPTCSSACRRRTC